MGVDVEGFPVSKKCTQKRKGLCSMWINKEFHSVAEEKEKKQSEKKKAYDTESCK